MADAAFTVITPNITSVTQTIALQAAATYNLVPIATNMMTLVVIANSNAASRTVTFASQNGVDDNVVVTVPGLTTVITGSWSIGRWADPLNATLANVCKVTYSVAADISMCVLQVPAASL